jgi:SOS-response transcriptional repressor LexA
MPASMNDARTNLTMLADKSGSSLSALSAMLRRNRAYLQQFVTRGTPRRLSDEDRHILCAYFGVDEEALGGPSKPAMIRIPRLAVEAAAGVGRSVDGEYALGSYSFDAATLRSLTSAKPNNLSIIQVTGDSMLPTLNAGDDVMVDSTAAVRLRDGIHVLRRDDMLIIKRLTFSPTGTLTISSDNQAHPTWHDCDPKSVSVIGRVIWASRKFG